jgi:hypothetical protein
MVYREKEKEDRGEIGGRRNGRRKWSGKRGNVRRKVTRRGNKWCIGRKRRKTEGK